MRKAIITGATGLIGTAVAKYLAVNGVDVLCLGRRHLDENEFKKLFDSENIKYLNIKMEDIQSLAEEIKKIDWSPGDSCVFYNFAWGGQNKLTNGDLSDQFKNAIYSTNAVLTAKKIGCTKFVNVGTLEESFAEVYLNDIKDNPAYSSSQLNYTIAKLASRDMCKMVSYLHKIDYIHTRLSVPLDPKLENGGYISTVLSRINEGKSFEKPQNNQLFDIILTEDVAKAYYLIGSNGKNKADYFIGTSQPETLNFYFETFEKLKSGLEEKIAIKNDNREQIQIFSTENLVKDTGFVLPGYFEDFMKNKVLK